MNHEAHSWTIKRVFLTFCLILMAFVFFACSGDDETKEVRVTFNTMGGNAIVSQTYEVSADNLPTLPTPTRTGYTFEGWYVDQDLLVIFMQAMLLTNTQVTIYASWSVDTSVNRTITFQSNGGSTVPTQSAAPGATISAPTAPTRVGHSFLGWFSDASLLTAYTFSDMPIESITVYAKWQINTYTITFETDGGNAIDPMIQTYNASITAPLTPTREGHIFLGWFSNVGLTTAYTFTTMPAENITIYAKWEAEPPQTFTVSFNLANGILISGVLVQEIEVGQGAVAPVVEKEGYDFAGWDEDFSAITGHLTVTAQFTIKTYTVTFKNYDGSNLREETVDHGSGATAPGSPNRVGYDFIGWDVVFNDIRSNLTVMAQYTIKTYTVTFEDFDGVEITEVVVNHGSGATAPANPVREGYYFAGWNVSFNNVTSNLTVTAQYTIKTYTVVFENFDGSILDQKTVNHGSDATAPADPIREGYDFTGWDIPFIHITSNLTVTAQYTVKSYTVIFEDFDGTEIKKEVVNHGDGATAPVDPERVGYDFIFWSIAFNNVTSNLTVIAEYTIKTYTVSFKDFDGSNLGEEIVDHGSGATAPGSPNRVGYDFIGWDVVFNDIRSDLTVMAQYAIKTYTVTFEDFDGVEITEVVVNHGSGATAPADPVREGYYFAGWNVSFNNVTSNLTVTAQYTIKTYTVVFENYDGSVLDEKTVNHGSDATAPAAPTREGYDFTGWDIPFIHITSNLTVTAQYTVKSYTVTFEDFDGTELEEEVVNHGDGATAPVDPVRVGYYFIGWSIAFNNVTSNLTVIAEYTIKTYTITFEDYDGAELKEEIVNHGSSATAPPDPVREGYVFIGWSADFSVVTASLVIVAQYEEEVIEEPKENHFFLRVKTQTESQLVIEFVLGGDVYVNGYDLRLTYVSADITYASHVNGVANIVNPNNPDIVSFNYADVMNALTQETVLLTITFNIVGSGTTDFGIIVIEVAKVNQAYEVVLVPYNTTGLAVVLS